MRTPRQPSFEREEAFTSDSGPANYERYLAPYLFEPWAQVLLDTVGVQPGLRVLDVASGTGVVSRAAALRIGTGGRVLATDISPSMIEFNAAHPPRPDAAPIETVVASATDLGGADGAFDVVLCQQGLPFFPDRVGALREMHRVLRRGGVAGVSVWSGHGATMPFGPIHTVFGDLGVPEPFPGAWAMSSFVVAAAELTELLARAGFTDVRCREIELVTHWPDLDHLTNVILGTPFAGVLASLSPDRQDEVRRLLRQHYEPFAMAVANVDVPTFATVAVATA